MRPLSIALLSWEYPPVVVGGLARHVHGLARGLAGEGHRVTVYTRGGGEAGDRDGVRVVPAHDYPPPLAVEDFVPWVLGFNVGLIHTAEAEIQDDPPDVIHAHDWLVTYAGAVLKDLAGVPLVATIHATELGRHGGRLPGSVQRYIHEVERWLVAEAERVVTCSAYMREEVRCSLNADEDRLDLIPNEVDVDAYGSRVVDVRSELWPADRPTLLFAGRLEYEKGVQTILDALPSLPGAGLVVAGDGTYRQTLDRLVADRGLGDRVRFEGFVGEGRLRELYQAADVAVVPSLYEPFGLVALEAMASGTPLVVSDTGGLREIVEDRVTGLLVPPADPVAFAGAARSLLADRPLAARLAGAARSSLDARRSWRGAAVRTAETYRRAMTRPRASRRLRPLARRA